MKIHKFRRSMLHGHAKKGRTKEPAMSLDHHFPDAASTLPHATPLPQCGASRRSRGRPAKAVETFSASRWVDAFLEQGGTIYEQKGGIWLSLPWPMSAAIEKLLADELGRAEVVAAGAHCLAIVLPATTRATGKTTRIKREIERRFREVGREFLADWEAFRRAYPTFGKVNLVAA